MLTSHLFADLYVPLFMRGCIVATESFDDSWYPGDALDTTVFAEAGEITKVTITIRYESKDARDTASRSGMEHGMAAGYSRLEELLAFPGWKAGGC